MKPILTVTLHSIDGMKDIMQARNQNAEVIRLVGPAVGQFCELIVGKFDPNPDFEKTVLGWAKDAAEIRLTKGGYSGGNLGSLMGYDVERLAQVQ